MGEYGSSDFLKTADEASSHFYSSLSEWLLNVPPLNYVAGSAVSMYFKGKRTKLLWAVHSKAPEEGEGRE